MRFMSQSQPMLERSTVIPRTAPARAAELASERDGNLPVWVRAPKRGHEFFTGCSRPKLYEWAAKGYIRSISIREPGQVKGVRLFHLASILAFIEQCEARAKAKAAFEANGTECGAPALTEATAANPS